jgi:hypothetical protein
MMIESPATVSTAGKISNNSYFCSLKLFSMICIIQQRPWISVLNPETGCLCPGSKDFPGTVHGSKSSYAEQAYP